MRARISRSKAAAIASPGYVDQKRRAALQAIGMFNPDAGNGCLGPPALRPEYADPGKKSDVGRRIRRDKGLRPRRLATCQPRGCADEHEFLTADPGDGLVFPSRLFHDGGDLSQDLVSGRMPEATIRWS